MIDTLFNSEFAKNSKFDKSFVGNVLNHHQWLFLVSQFKSYLKNVDQNDSEFFIPKKIHQIWLGDKKPPKRCLPWMKSWQKLNPDWEYQLWDEERIKQLKIKDFNVYSKKINPGYRSDILRYIILSKYGGLYVDTDFECLKSIPSNILKYKFIAGLMFGSRPCIGNSILFSSPNYMLLKRILNKIKLTEYKNDINSIIQNSGPEIVTKEYFSIEKIIGKESLILPSNYFYPYPNFMLNKKVDKYKEIEDISIGIHHWEMSWMKGNLLNRILNKIKKYLKMINNIFSIKICK